MDSFLSIKYCSQSRDQDSNISPIHSCQLPKLICFDSFFEPQQIQAFDEPREYKVRPYYGRGEGTLGAAHSRKKIFSPTKCKCDKQKCAKGFCDCQAQGIYCTICRARANHEHEPWLEKKVKTCRCKKSGCQKGYCECYSNGDYCSDECRCQQCKNKKNPSSFKITTLGIITSDLIQNSLITRRLG